ncbi:MAG: potassium transporter Kup [Phycisphaeraceae bacterium]|nr:potassium transporter Kup [Phycisphaeraceae bacterium]
MAHAHAPTSRRELAHLCLLAVGIVYGDIGTSPLYAIRECFHGEHAIAISSANVLGILSLVFWTLLTLVTIKYHIYVLRADNNGEGGILAMVALVQRAIKASRFRTVMLALGLFGAALLYGDGVLTPAISVISAVEGLKIAAPGLASYVVPITIGILVTLFAFQRHGTGGVGLVFGPIMVVWFAVLAVLGVASIVHHPEVLWAVNPFHAVTFLWHNAGSGFLVLGAVFLVATGGEALYADLGHFGNMPIQIGGLGLVAPALVLNYFGQGALLLHDPSAAVNPFYALVPRWGLYPLIALATMATIIASQAVISGVFSLTSQAVQLGYIPRVRVVHTSSREIGQVYLPGINWLMMLGTIALVIGFKTSSNMASAYGVAIATTMVITTLLAFPVAYGLWKWKLPLALLVTLAFLSIDLTFFGANIVKVADGGWLPLLMGLIVYLVMTTWKRGRELLGRRVAEHLMKTDDFLRDLAKHPPLRVPGTAVFLTGNADSVPLAMMHHLNHNKVLHERIVCLTIRIHETSRVKDHERTEYRELGQGFHQVIAHYGYMQDPNVPATLQSIGHGLNISIPETTFFLGREMLLVGPQRDMATWRKRLFIALSRNAQPVTSFFHIPPNRVVEIGTQVEL